VTRPLPDHATPAPQTAAHHHPKGSDHDHRDHHGAQGDGRAADAGPNEHEASHGDRADSPDGGDRSDTDRPRRRRQSTAVGRAERAGDGSTPPAPHHPTVAPSRRVTDATSRTRRRSTPPRPIPTPEEWAQEQLKHAPERSREWAAKVAAIYGLELSADDSRRVT
jgi:hypothetical protein